MVIKMYYNTEKISLQDKLESLHEYCLTKCNKQPGNHQRNRCIIFDIKNNIINKIGYK